MANLANDWALGFPLLAALGLLGGCAVGDHTTNVRSIPVSQVPSDFTVEHPRIQTLCQIDETVAFSGDVHDGFGLTISVCIGRDAESDVPLLSIRSEGEGGSSVISCLASACDGIIQFEHYRRYRFSVLTLKWGNDGSRQRLVESFNAEDPFRDPVHSVTHIWSTKEARARGIEPEPYPVVAVTAPLSLLKLESVFGDRHL